MSPRALEVRFAARSPRYRQRSRRGFVGIRLHATETSSISNPADITRTDTEFVRAVLDVMLVRTGLDFSCYRLPTVARRIGNRMLSVGISSAERYLCLLRTSESEPQRLLERITIKVSRFYRHAATFDHLRTHVLPELASEGAPVKLRSVGCGAGEEAYTLAMLLDEANIPGTIEAIDIDASALEDARVGIYPLGSIAELPPELAARYLEPVVTRGRPGYRVHSVLRERLRFARRDITSPSAEASPSHFDLVSCRNVLIYLQRAAQTAATRRLVDMIRPGGVLCLGEAEWPLPDIATRLDPFAHRTRLFRVRRAEASERWTPPRPQLFQAGT